MANSEPGEHVLIILPTVPLRSSSLTWLCPLSALPIDRLPSFRSRPTKSAPSDQSVDNWSLWLPEPNRAEHIPGKRTPRS